MRCSAWRDLAEHCASTLSKGMRVIAQGRLQQRSYQAQDGSNRTVIEMTIDEIDCRYVTRPRRSRARPAATAKADSPAWQWRQWRIQRRSGQWRRFRRQRRRLPGWPWQWRLQRWLSGWRQWRLPGWASAAGNAGQSAAPATDPWGTSGDAGSSFGSFGGSSDFGGDSQEPEF